MANPHCILIGTTKGVFLHDATGGLSGPHCDGAPINHVIGDGEQLWAAGGDDWLGRGVWRSDDRGASWTRFDAGLSLGVPRSKGSGHWAARAMRSTSG
ncbi:hypothetical protein [Oceanibium sediminis]|uniref:hypothetical protein n=1 Tax=Oceanibium sediminis TaxID=2026339 RepID=UPI00280BBC22|nr:hypothetical protein [Oceanibium sediminis]